MLENEFKQCVYLDTNSNSSRRSLSKFVVTKHLWWELLHEEPCFCLDVLVYMLKCVFCSHILITCANFRHRKKTQKRAEFKTRQKYTEKFVLHQQIVDSLSTECLNDTHTRILDDIGSACGVPWGQRPPDSSHINCFQENP